MGTPGDEIKALPIEPKVRDALAKFADQSREDVVLPQLVGNEVKAAQAQAANRPAGAEMYNHDKHGDRVGFALTNDLMSHPDLVEAFQTIVSDPKVDVRSIMRQMTDATQQISDAIDPKVSSERREAVAQESHRILDGAWQTLVQAAQAGVDKAIAPPVHTPVNQDQAPSSLAK